MMQKCISSIKIINVGCINKLTITVIANLLADIMITLGDGTFSFIIAKKNNFPFFEE